MGNILKNYETGEYITIINGCYYVTQYFEESFHFKNSFFNSNNYVEIRLKGQDDFKNYKVINYDYELKYHLRKIKINNLLKKLENDTKY